MNTLTASDLIQVLQELPPNMPVWIESYDGEIPATEISIKDIQVSFLMDGVWRNSNETIKVIILT